MSLTEVERWDLEDIDKALSMVDMKMDYEEARAGKMKKDLEGLK